MSDVHTRLKTARELAGYASAAEAARALGIVEASYFAHENGSRGLRPQVAAKYAERFDVSLEWLLTGRGTPRPGVHSGEMPPTTASYARYAQDKLRSGFVSTVHRLTPEGIRAHKPPLYGGRIAAGLWQELDLAQHEEPPAIPLSADPRYADIETQLVYRVDGDSMSAVVEDGTYVYAVSYWEARRAVTSGDLAIVERRRGDLVERTLKRIRVLGDVVELWPESRDSARWNSPLRVPIRLFENGEESDGEDVQIVALVTGSYRPL